MGKNYKKYVLHITIYDSARFMTISLSNLVNNLSQGIHKIKCKYRHYDRNVKLVELNINIATIFLNTPTLNMT